MANYEENSRKYWNKYYLDSMDKNLIIADWLDRFSKVIENSRMPIIDLGCGLGYDTKYLLSKYKKVIACDISEEVIDYIRKNFNVEDAKAFNMLDRLPFQDNSADLIIADLSLHYFTHDDTFYVLKEIKRVLTNKGYLIFRVNSINDINHKPENKNKIEKNLFLTDDNRLKRFFSKEDVEYFFKDFDIEYIKEESLAKYRHEKYVYTCLARNNK